MKEYRTGQGFDVHAFCEGDSLTLCGITFPFSHSLAGHSDADVALHALTDAILGSIAEFDIGYHFPPDDTRWHNASSDIFLFHALALLQKKKAKLTFCDITLICEQPKIRPLHTEMQKNLTKLLKLDINRISLKATTTEKLGFTGRGEGIATMAVVTIMLPNETV